MTTATHWTHNRARGRRGPGTSGFTTRLEGAAMRRSVWACLSCRAWLEPERRTDREKPGRPVACRHCGERALLFFDSRGEAAHFMRLWLLEDHGRVRGLRHHPRFALVAPDPSGALHVIGHYEADAEFEELLDDGTWARRVDDFKPKDPQAQDPLFKWKRRHVERQYGLTIRIVSG